MMHGFQQIVTQAARPSNFVVHGLPPLGDEMGVSPLMWRKKLMDSISGNLGYMNEKIYPSDLTDEEWEWIKDVIPAAKRGGRPRTLCMRAVLNAIFYVTKGGI